MTSRDDGLRPLNGPQPIVVTASDRGRPEVVSERGRMRRVVAIHDAWRIDDEWWRSQPISRRYLAVMLEGGRSVTIYRDLYTGEWFRQSYGRPRGFA